MPETGREKTFVLLLTNLVLVNLSVLVNITTGEAQQIKKERKLPQLNKVYFQRCGSLYVFMNVCVHNKGLFYKIMC